MIFISDKTFRAADKYYGEGLSHKEVRKKLLKDGLDKCEVESLYLLETHEQDENGNFIKKDKDSKVISYFYF